jgi:trimethylamine-N-oxide reductase (cytochrome c)
VILCSSTLGEDKMEENKAPTAAAPAATIAPVASPAVSPALEQEQTFLEEIWQLAAVDVKNGKIVRRRPWHDDITGIRPFTCIIKGKTWTAPTKSPLAPYALAYKKRVYSPNRILYPLQRVDWEPGGDPAKTNTKNRGASKYKRISWDEATDIIAKEITRLCEKYGPSAITAIQSPHGEKGMVHKDHGINNAFLGYYSYTKYGQFHTERAGSPASWEGSAWGAKHVWGFEVFGQETGQTMKDTLENCQLMLHWGSDGGAKNWNSPRGQIGDMLLYYSSELGIEHVYICPDVNSEAQAHMDKWIPVLPGTDPALQLAIAYTWIKEDTYDKAYLATHSVGFDTFKAYVLGEEDGVPKTPAWAAPLCKVPEWTIKALARNFAKNRTSICHKMDGGGLKRAPYCHEAARLEVYLLAMQGWGRPGVHQLKGIALPTSAHPPRFARGVEPSMDAQPAPLTKALNGRVLREWDTDRPFIPGNEIPKAINDPPVEWYGGGVMTRTETQFVKRTYPFPGKSEVHMLWSDGPGYFIGAGMDGNSTWKALQNPKVEFILVQHPWMDSGTNIADIILPINTKHEKYDFTANSAELDGIYLEGKAIEPIGESRSDYEAVCEIAKKLNFYDEWTRGKSIEEWVKEGFNKSGWTDLVSWEVFSKQGYFCQPLDPNWQEAKPTSEAFYNDPEKNPLQTPTGKVEFYSERLAEKFPNDKERGPVAHYVIGGPASEGWTHDESLQGERAKKYPLLVMSSNRTWGEHQQCTDIPWVREISKVPGPDGYWYEPVKIHPSDAAKRGIEQGDIVKLFNERGIVLGVAILTEKIIPGAAAMEKGGGIDFIAVAEINRGGTNNLIAPHMGVSKNAMGLAVTSYLAELARVTANEMEAWRKQYPEAFARNYDPAYGPLFKGWVVSSSDD